MLIGGYTKKELLEIIGVLKEAYKRAATSGGVTSYTLNSGQGSTTVQSASLSTIKNELAYFSNLYNEAIEYGSGSHCSYIRDLGVM